MELEREWLSHFVNVRNELFTLKWLILCSVHFVSIKIIVRIPAVLRTHNSKGTVAQLQRGNKWQIQTVRCPSTCPWGRGGGAEGWPEQGPVPGPLNSVSEPPHIPSSSHSPAQLLRARMPTSPPWGWWVAPESLFTA